MVNVSKMFLLAGSLCLVSPVMACDDDLGDENVADMSEVSVQPASQRSASFAEILSFSKELAGMDDGEYDDGDYADAPVAVNTKPAKKQKQAKSTAKPKAKVVKKKVDNKAKTYALKASFNQRTTADPFE